jgi:hypothetical protein
VFAAPDPYTEDGRRRNLPGRVPFVVPPAAPKSPYYRNAIIREVWQQAAHALRRADRVFIVGYSLPPTDLTFASMLTDTLIKSPSYVTIVDLRPAAVAERLCALGFPEDRVEVFESAIQPPAQAFSARWRDAASTGLLDFLRTPPSILTMTR